MSHAIVWVGRHFDLCTLKYFLLFFSFQLFEQFIFQLLTAVEELSYIFRISLDCSKVYVRER